MAITHQIAKINVGFAHPQMHYVYVLHSSKDNSLYIGSTSNLKRRFKEHNQGKSPASAPKTPYKLIFYEAFPSKIDALNREKYLKSGYGRRTLKKMLKNYFERNN